MRPFIFYLGESSASELRLPPGDEKDNYLVGLQINIYDRFGDYSTVCLNVQVGIYE